MTNESTNHIPPLHKGRARGWSQHLPFGEAGWGFLLLAIIALCSFSVSKSTRVVYMIGDSTMADKDLKKGTPERGWGMVLQGFFDDQIIVENHAVNGRSTKSFIDEGRWQKVVDKLQPGDYVIIQFGHNDEKPDEKRHTVAWGSFNDNLTRFVIETRAKGAQPILLNATERRSFYAKKADGSKLDDELLRNTPYGVEEKVNSDTLIPSHGDYAEVPRVLGKVLKVPFVDATLISRKMENDHGVDGSRQLHVWFKPGEIATVPEGRQDNTHYSIYGAHTLASLLVDAIAEAEPSLKPHVRHYDYIVSAEGRGNYASLDEAVNAAPSHGATTILILDGTWTRPKTSKSIRYKIRKGAKVK